MQAETFLTHLLFIMNHRGDTNEKQMDTSCHCNGRHFDHHACRTGDQPYLFAGTRRKRCPSKGGFGRRPAQSHTCSRTGETYASSHFIIGLDGEIIQCIPLNEISYCSNERNDDTIAIECCHPDEGGQFTEATYNSLLRLTSWLCQSFSLDPSSDVIRHYDVTGKECPLYYVKNPQAWQQFLSDLSAFDPET